MHNWNFVPKNPYQIMCSNNRAIADLLLTLVVINNKYFSDLVTLEKYFPQMVTLAGIE